MPHEESNELNSLSLTKHWLQGAGFGAFLQVGGLALAFGSSVAVARLLGADGLGKYSFALSVAAILSVLASLGLPTVVTKLVSSYQLTHSWGRARGLVFAANFTATANGLMLALLTFFFVSHHTHDPWLAALPLIPILALANIRQRALQALHFPLAAQLPEQFVKHSIFLSLCGIIFLAKPSGNLSAGWVMNFWLLSSILSLIAGSFLLKKLSPARLKSDTREYELSTWLNLSFPILVTDTLNVLFTNSNILILGWIASDTDIGHYQIAFRVSGLLLVFLAASNMVLAPWFSKFHESKDTNRMQSVITKTTRVVFSITLIPYLILGIWGDSLLELFFGDSFKAAYFPLMVLGFGQLINIASGPVVNLLNMSGGQKTLAYFTAAAVVLNGTLTLLLTPFYGVMGCAISMCLAISIYNISLIFAAKRRTGISSSIFG